jgi:hypothetical protein
MVIDIIVLNSILNNILYNYIDTVMSTINDERSSLKVKILQDQLDILRKKMLSAMDILCTMSGDFADLEEKITGLQGGSVYKESDSVEHTKVPDVGLPDVGDNTSIWDRIAKAHEVMDNKDHNLMGSVPVKKELMSVAEDCDASTFEQDMQNWLEDRKNMNTGV